MQSYYSNSKIIDQFLRDSATYIDRARGHLSDSQQFKGVVEKFNKQFNAFIASTGTKKDDDKQKDFKGNEDEVAVNYRMTQCPNEDIQVRLWSKDELVKYDGNSGETEIYLGFLGLVYNVTIGRHHYGPGAEYNIFAGRDATRAFVTGNFTHDLHDDIRDIDESMYSHIESWASFYGSSYPVLGRIEGQFFDSRGCGTAELGRVYSVFNKLAHEKADQQEQEKSLPECNSEWNGDLKKGRVWCSVKSGGIERDWIGVPRLYHDGQTKRCVCLNQDGPETTQYSDVMEVYPDCDPNATECTLTQ